MIVVADTSPINYLVLLDLQHLLEELFRTVFLPHTVLSELRHATAPAKVRLWASSVPSWVHLETPTLRIVAASDNLDPGERAAIDLAYQLQADLLLIDEKAARRVADKLGFDLRGTLGILSDAHRAKKIDGLKQYDRLCKTTTFRHNARTRKLFLESLQNSP